MKATNNRPTSSPKKERGNRSNKNNAERAYEQAKAENLSTNRGRYISENNIVLKPQIKFNFASQGLNS